MGAAAFCLLQDSIQHSGNNGQPRQAAPGMPGPNEAIRTHPAHSSARNANRVREKGEDDDDRRIDRDAATCLNMLYADLEKETHAPERIREAVPAGATAWRDAGVVVIQAREGITEREFGRFRQRGIPTLAVQGLRQQGLRGRSNNKSGTTPRRKPRLYRTPPTSVARLFRHIYTRCPFGSTRERAMKPTPSA